MLRFTACVVLVLAGPLQAQAPAGLIVVNASILDGSGAAAVRGAVRVRAGQLDQRRDRGPASARSSWCGGPR